MIVAVALFVSGYLSMGYGTFRLWAWMRPPRQIRIGWGGLGEYTWCFADSVTEVAAGFWLSLTIWPLLWGLFLVTEAFSFITEVGTATVIPKKPKDSA